MDAELYEECQRQHAEKEAKAKDLVELRERNWKRLADAAAQNGVEDMVTTQPCQYTTTTAGEC